VGDGGGGGEPSGGGCVTGEKARGRWGGLRGARGGVRIRHGGGGGIYTVGGV